MIKIFRRNMFHESEVVRVDYFTNFDFLLKKLPLYETIGMLDQDSIRSFVRAPREETKEVGQVHSSLVR